MPLAFDFTSTFARGSILPVATTERAMSPFSTATSLEGSISTLERDAETAPMPASTAPGPPPAMARMRRLRRERFWASVMGIPPPASRSG